VVPKSHRCDFANAGHYRSALAIEVSGERNCVQYAGVSRGVSLRGKRADGQSERVQSVVTEMSFS
jgi:hypothetical protein